MTKQIEHATLYDAFLAVQGELQNPKFDAKNPMFKNGYASLKCVRDTIIPVCNKHGIVVTQKCAGADNDDHSLPGVVCRTTLIFKNESMSDEMFFPFKRAYINPPKGAELEPVYGTVVGPQEAGGTITYIRRYSLLAVFCLVGEEDDDGEAAEGRGGQAPQAYAKKDVPLAKKLWADLKAADSLSKVEEIKSKVEAATKVKTVTPEESKALTDLAASRVDSFTEDGEEPKPAAKPKAAAKKPTKVANPDF